MGAVVFFEKSREARVHAGHLISRQLRSAAHLTCGTHISHWERGGGKISNDERDEKHERGGLLCTSRRQLAGSCSVGIQNLLKPGL
jgi:hypothetical protein